MEKHDAIAKAAEIEKKEMLAIWQLNGFLGLHMLGLEHMYGYLAENGQDEEQDRKHGHWITLEDCANAGVYCSVSIKKYIRKIMGTRKSARNIAQTAALSWMRRREVSEEETTKNPLLTQRIFLLLKCEMSALRNSGSEDFVISNMRCGFLFMNLGLSRVDFSFALVIFSHTISIKQKRRERT